ncbi:hypothetical protein PINS_up006489 [Pythium insidiosum]|nr:hypothetical protein PINS_up006489 [Pythium insidiosum]
MEAQADMDHGCIKEEPGLVVDDANPMLSVDDASTALKEMKEKAAEHEHENEPEHEPEVSAVGPGTPTIRLNP